MNDNDTWMFDGASNNLKAGKCLVYSRRATSQLDLGVLRRNGGLRKKVRYQTSETPDT